MFLASDAGLSVLQISADAVGRRGFGAVEKTLNGVPVVSYCEVQTTDPYEFVASRADLSVMHDEYMEFSGFAAAAGFSLCRSHSSDRNYYAVVGEGGTVIFDGETAVSSFGDTANCAAYAAMSSGGKALIAADSGLSAIDVLYDSGKDVSTLGGVSLIAAGQFVAVKCQAAATALCAAYAATATGIYEISGDWTIGPSPAISGFSSIRAVDGYCFGGKNALIVLDGDRLKACDPKTGAVSSYAALSGIDELAVVGDESDLA